MEHGYDDRRSQTDFRAFLSLQPSFLPLPVYEGGYKTYIAERI